MRFQFSQKLIFVFVLTAIVFLEGSFFVEAKKALPIPGSAQTGHLSDPSGETAEQKFGNLVFAFYQDILYIIGAVAVLLLIYSGFRMVTAGGEEDVITKQKEHIRWTVIGLILISLATQVDKIFFFGNEGDYEGTFLTDTERALASSGIFNENVFIVIAFIKVVISIVAIFFIVRAGANLVLQGFNEETLNKEKKNITIGLISLIGINLASTVVNKILFNVEENFQGSNTVEPTVDLMPGIEEIIGITNFVVTFVGPVAILALIIGAVYYMISVGDEERMGKAKKIIVNSIIGILIIYGAFGLVTTFVAGSIEGTQTENNN